MEKVKNVVFHHDPRCGHEVNFSVGDRFEEPSSACITRIEEAGAGRVLLYLIDGRTIVIQGLTYQLEFIPIA